METPIRRRRIETDKAPPSTGFRSQALAAGGLLFTGGMIGAPMLPDGGVRAPAPTLAEQIDLCLRHLEQVTIAAGGDKSQVVEVSAFLVPRGEAEAVEQQVADFLGRAVPLFNFREVSDVAMHGLIEMDWIAVETHGPSIEEAAEWIKPLGHAEGITSSGPFLVMNGLTAPGTSLSEQSFGVLREADHILRSLGGGLEDLVKLTVFIADFDSYPQFNNATRDLFADLIPPTRSVVVAPEIAGSALVRVDLLALRTP